MEAYGDGFVIAPGLIKGDNYSYLVDAKTVLFVQRPFEEANKPQRAVPLFFFAMAGAVMGGVIWTQQAGILFLPMLVVAFAAAVSLVKSFRRPNAAEWKLFVGAGETPVLIYASSDEDAFEAKRLEIERALLGRLLNEE